MENNFSSIGDQIKLMKNDYRERITKLKSAIDNNYEFLLKIVDEYQYLFNFKKLVILKYIENN